MLPGAVLCWKNKKVLGKENYFDKKRNVKKNKQGVKMKLNSKAHECLRVWCWIILNRSRVQRLWRENSRKKQICFYDFFLFFWFSGFSYTIFTFKVNSERHSIKSVISTCVFFLASVECVRPLNWKYVLFSMKSVREWERERKGNI